MKVLGLTNYLKNRIGETVLQSILNTTGKTVGLVITTGFLIYISRVLTLKEIGIFAILNIMYGLISVFMNLGLGTTAVKLLPVYIEKSDNKNIASVVSSAIFFTGMVATLILTIVFLYRENLSVLLLKSNSYSYFIVLSAIYAFFNFYADLLLLINKGLRDFKSAVRINLLNVTSQISIALVLLFLGIGLKSLFLGFAIGALITCIYGFYKLKRFLGLRFVTLSLIKFSMPYYLNDFGRYGFFKADQMIIAIFFNPATLGGYYLAKRVSNVFRLFFDSLREPITSRLIQLKPNSIKYIVAFKKSSVVSVLLAIFINFLIILFSGKIIEFIGGYKFLRFKDMLICLSVVNIIFSLYAIANMDFFIRRSPTFYFAINLVGSFIVLCTMVISGFIGGHYEAIILSPSIGYILVFVVFLCTRSFSHGK